MHVYLGVLMYLSVLTPPTHLPGLNIIFTVVKSVLDYPEVCQGFFQLYFLPIVEEIFAVVSEASHTSSTLHYFALNTTQLIVPLAITVSFILVCAS